MEAKTQNINLAILILAHKNIHQLRRLINTVKHDNMFIFVHLDKKWNIEEGDLFQLRQLPNVIVCKNRISAELDKWSLVEATMELIHASKEFELNSKIKFQYFSLLSAQDYPIKNSEFIVRELTESYPTPFIDCTPYHHTNWVASKFNSFPLEIKLNCWIDERLGRNIFRKLVKLPYWMTFKVLKIFRPKPWNNLNKLGYSVYGGSAWWILPDTVIDEIVKRFQETPDKFIKIMAQTITPEETFFQIMTMSLPTGKMVDLNSPYTTAQNCLTYAHFSDVGKPFFGHPYILEKSDFEMLGNRKEFFARKFDMSVDEEIMNLIDKNFLRIANT